MGSFLQVQLLTAYHLYGIKLISEHSNIFLNSRILLDISNKHNFYTPDMIEEYLYFCVKCNCDFWIGPHVNIFYDNKYLPIPISLNVGNYIISNYGDDLGFPNAGSSFHYCINLTCSKFILLSCAIIFFFHFCSNIQKIVLVSAFLICCHLSQAFVFFKRIWNLDFFLIFFLSCCCLLLNNRLKMSWAGVISEIAFLFFSFF